MSKSLSHNIWKFLKWPSFPSGRSGPYIVCKHRCLFILVTALQILRVFRIPRKSNRSARIIRQYIVRTKVNWDASALPRGVISVEEEFFSSRHASQAKTMERTLILLVEERLIITSGVEIWLSAITARRGWQHRALCAQTLLSAPR